jgi:hypothetical protein
LYWSLLDQGYSREAAKRVLKRTRRLLPPDDPVLLERTTLLEYVDNPLCSTPTVTPTEIVMVRPDSLTDEVIQKARFLESEYTIWDGSVPGLGLRIRPSGHKTFILVFRVRGLRQSLKMTLANAGTITLNMAREMAHQHLFVAKMGDDPRKEMLKRNDVKYRKQKQREYSKQLENDYETRLNSEYNSQNIDERELSDEERMLNDEEREWSKPEI